MNHRGRNTAALVRARRLAGLSSQRPRRVLPKQVLPSAIQQQYARELTGVVDIIEEEVRKETPTFERILSSSASLRQDANEGAQVRQGIDEITRRISARMPDLTNLAQKFATQTSTYQRIQLSRQVQAAFGTDVLTSDPNLAPLIDGFVAENVALIRDMPTKTLGEIEQTVLRGVTAGKLHRDIAAEIDQRFEVGRSRARLIARDQVGKFYGQVNAARQKDMGVEEFIWRTVNDGRVRERHRTRDGNRYDYASPPNGELPGEPINCRCYAEPVFDELRGIGTERDFSESQDVPEGHISLSQIAQMRGVDPKNARALLRKLNIPKPEHGWSWPASEAGVIGEMLKPSNPQIASSVRNAVTKAPEPVPVRAPEPEQAPTPVAPAPTPVPAPKPVQATSGATKKITLSEIAAAQGIDASKARAMLRKLNIEKPEEGWVFSEEDKDRIADLLAGKKPKTSPVPVQVVEIPTPPPPAPPKTPVGSAGLTELREFDGQFKNQGSIRRALNDIVKPYELVGREGPESLSFIVEDLGGARAEYHHEKGFLKVNPEIAKRLKEVGDDIANGVDYSRAPTEEIKSRVNAMRTVVHETLHAHSPVGEGQILIFEASMLEEATTEITARRIIKEKFSIKTGVMPELDAPHESGLDKAPYQDFIKRATLAVEKTFNVSPAQAYGMLEKASFQFKRHPSMVKSAQEYTQTLVDAFDYSGFSEKHHDKLKKRLMKNFDVMGNQAHHEMIGKMARAKPVSQPEKTIRKS
jgi:SPP1 gp7 family putative phage head morphogenesis protein